MRFALTTYCVFGYYPKIEKLEKNPYFRVIFQNLRRKSACRGTNHGKEQAQKRAQTFLDAAVQVLFRKRLSSYYSRRST